jgi:hypothetical protein
MLVGSTLDVEAACEREETRPTRRNTWFVALVPARASAVRSIALGIALGLSVIEAVGVVVTNAPRGGSQDWHVFVDAGMRAGTPTLLHPEHAGDTFAYLPGYAWILVPLAHLPLTVSVVIGTLLMLACGIVSAVIAARVYGTSAINALVLTFAWTPVLNAIAIAQNATLGLVLALLAILGLMRASTLLTALPIGILLFKPTYALPLIALLIVRVRVRALGIVAACGAVWYLASVTATGGNWRWPVDYAEMIARYSGADFAFNAVKATSMPAVLIRWGAPMWAIVLASLVLLIAVLAKLRQVDACEAGSAVCLAGLALSPHAWPYDAALATPMIVLAWTRLPLRLTAIEAVVIAVTGPLFLLSSLIGINPQAVVVIGGTIAWLIVRRTPART